MENTINQFDPSRARAGLMKMLSELSVDALEYVWRPIVYAYYLTDENNPDALSNEDAERFSLIGAAAHDSPEIVHELSEWKGYLWRREWKKARAKA